MVVIAIGTATNNVDIVPAITPSIRANTNPRIVSPPSRNITSSTTNVENEVENVRTSVALTASLIVYAIGRFGYRVRSSRTRSNTTTVSFIE